MRSDRLRARLAFALVLVAMSMIAAGCSQPAGASKEAPKPTAATQPQAAAPAVAATASPSTDATASAPAPKKTAKQVADKRCKGCHSASKALRYRTSKPSAARAMIRSMERRGASLSAEEAAIIVAYYLR